MAPPIVAEPSSAVQRPTRDANPQHRLSRWDGQEIARRTWSWIGLGELHASADVDGAPVEVHVALEWGGLSQLDGRCTITVGGEPIPVERVA